MALEPKALYEFGPFRLDSRDHLLFQDGERLSLAPKVLQILVVLVERAGHLVEKRELMERIWPDANVEEGSLTFHMSQLREALGDAPRPHRYIETVPKSGYRFVAPVTVVQPNSALSPPKSSTFTGWRWFSGAMVASIATITAAFIVWELARSVPISRALEYTQITSDGRYKSGNLVTDGARLYFVEALPTGSAIVQVATSGGDVQALSSVFKNPEVEDLNPGRAEMLVLDPGGIPGHQAALWSLPLTGGRARRVGNIFADAAAWSADGNSIAYSLSADLYVSRSDGTENRRIASVGGPVHYIRWSPDNKRLRFTLRTGTELNRIWQIDADGSGLRTLFTDWNDSESTDYGTWAPDGKHFLFARGVSGVAQVWTSAEPSGAVALQRGARVQITTGPLPSGMCVPSPDGRRVFFACYQGRSELLRFERNSKDFRPYLPSVSANEVAFSRDGQWIAYSVDGRLWRRRTDGSEPLQLTFAPLHVEMPRWSPDGKQIAFMGRTHPGDIFHVFLIPANGGEYYSVLPASYPQGAPTWSPDGTKLAFGELPDKEGTEAKPTIHVLDLTTREATSIPGSTGLWSARWSPDGQRLAALTVDSRTLMVFEFGREKWESVATTTGNISDLNWSHDSTIIYFEDRLPPQGPAIFRVSLRDLRVELIASLKREPPIHSDWLGLMPDDSPLVSNDTHRSEIYSLDWQRP